MHRVLTFLGVLSWSSAAFAAPYEGLRTGMTEAQARAILGPDVTRNAFDGGFNLATQRSGGRVLGIDICTRNGAPVVSAVSESLGSSLVDFSSAVEEETARYGTATWKTRGPTPPSRAFVAIEATWATPDGRLLVTFVQLNENYQAYRSLQGTC
jgi:hypothetical protein